LHLPTLEFDAVDRRLGRSPVLAGGVASFSLLSRSEPYYRSHNVGRTDLYPHFSIPWIVDGWTFRPEVGLRETWYSHSQSLGPVPPPPSPPQSTFFPSEDAVPITENASLNRKAVELDLQILPPVLTRDFHEQYLGRRFGVAIRHAIEPEINYRYVAGVNKFNQAPRFDPIDIYSDTNEVEYGLTQRLFLKRLRRAPCPALQPASQPDQAKRQESCGSSSRQWLSWFLGQKYFADPTFGGAVIAGRRNIFASTLNFSGVDYITAPRSFSPIVSRLRIHPGSNLDIEWDYDYDTKKGRAAASNIFANFRKGNFFSSFGSALLNAVGETPVPPNQPQNVVKYDQLQFLAGYGSLTKPGLSGAFSGGVDLHSRSLEYTAVQATYNFDCCGFTAEYRQFHLGQIRNESQETFSFTLAGVGAAGNLKRAERLF
jgi:LPS-assembly protein